MLFDSDDDGYITFDDIKNTLESQGIIISDDMLAEMYDESGKKTTEKLNYEEFVPFLIKFAAVSPIRTNSFQNIIFKPILAQQKERFGSPSSTGDYYFINIIICKFLTTLILQQEEFHKQLEELQNQVKTLQAVRVKISKLN